MALQIHLPLHFNCDNSGNIDAVTSQSNVTYSDDGIKFAGVNSSFLKIQESNILSANLYKGFTISCKVKLTATNTTQALFCKRTNTGSGISIFYIANTGLRFDVGNSSPPNPAIPLNANTWYNLVFIYDPTSKNRYIYVNGELKGTVGSGSWSYLDQATYFLIGGSMNSTTGTAAPTGNYASYYMKDFRFYDEIIPLIKYPFSDSYALGNNSRVIPDVSPFGRHASQVRGTITLDSEGIGYVFNGSSAIQYAAGLGLAGKDKTLSFWVKTSASTFPTSATVIFTDQSSLIGCGFYSGNKFIVTSGSNSQDVFIANTYYKPRQWNHVAVVYTENVPIACYVNMNRCTASGKNYWSATGGLTIGARLNSTIQSFMTGSLKEFQIFDYKLSESELWRLYRAASISSQGDVTASSFIESSANKLKQNGIMNATTFNTATTTNDHTRYTNFKQFSDYKIGAHDFFER